MALHKILKLENFLFGASILLIQIVSLTCEKLLVSQNEMQFIFELPPPLICLTLKGDSPFPKPATMLTCDISQPS